MHVLFSHPSYTGQFGHLARLLVARGYECTFVSESEVEEAAGIRAIRYETGRIRRASYFSQDFDEESAHAVAVYEAVKEARPTLRPDLIVGHAGWGSTLLLPDRFPDTPTIGYFEYFYHPHGSAIDFRPDWPPPERAVLRHRLQNAMIMLQLESCTAGYTPTHFQHGLFPAAYGQKVRVLHDGIDTDFWKRTVEPVRRAGETRIVTYVSRGLESMRGFDIFMRAAKRIYESYPNVLFLVVGSDSVEYGCDLDLIPESSFKEHVLKQDDYDLDRIRFLGTVGAEELLRILSLSDLHIYLTVPFVLSWSVLNAMACGCTVLASDTAPVRELVRHGENGLLADFFDVEGIAAAAVEVLKDPDSFRELGRAAERTILDRYSLTVTLPQLAAFFEEVASNR